jgi:glycosyltransferase involved in cell wall biosynthesis
MRDDVYARTKLLLMPSDYESWGRVGVEAMASGIPVIAHPTEGLTESLGDAGTFIHRDDIPAWCDAITRLLKPRAWGAASKKAKARSAELDPARDLATWVQALEHLSRVPRR